MSPGNPPFVKEIGLFLQLLESASGPIDVRLKGQMSKWAD